MTTGILVVVIFIVILAQIAVSMMIAIVRRRRQLHNPAPQQASSAPVKYSQGDSESSVTQPLCILPAWEGFREFQVQRRVIEDLNQSICSFYLVPVDGKPLPSFKPGQFLTFRLPIKEPVTHEIKNIVRCYSLSDCSRPDYYRVSIKRVPAPASQPEVPPGLSSNYFHDHVQEGSRLMIKAPAGHFYLNEKESLPVVLIAGGIGITPMLSMLNTLLQINDTREIRLYYGVRNGDEPIMKTHLQSLVRAHANFHLHFCFSEPLDTDVLGIDYQHKGRIDIPLLRSTLQLKHYQFYVCGPKPMMESLVPGLEDWGVDSQDIYYESFGPATLIGHDKPKTDSHAVSSKLITVTFSKTGKRLQWNPEAGSILEFAEANEIEVESGCRAGSCGCCQTKIEAGEVEYSQQPEADINPGYCLLCTSSPKSDLTLAA